MKAKKNAEQLQRYIRHPILLAIICRHRQKNSPPAIKLVAWASQGAYIAGKKIAHPVRYTEWA